MAGKSMLYYVLPPVVGVITYAVYNRFSPSRSNDKNDILAEGGKVFSTADGRLMEYFEYGSPKEEAKHTMLAIHGAMSTGQLWKIHDQWGKEKKVRIISPTLPGWGLSDSNGITSTPKNWASTDALGLLKFLGFNDQKKIHLMGASLGSIYAANLACHPDASKMIDNVMLYVAFGPQSKNNDPLEGSQLRVFSQLHTYPTIARLVEKYLILPMMRSLFPGDAARSVRNQWEGLWKCTDDIYSKWDFDWTSMAKDRKVIIVSGNKDDLAPVRNQTTLKEGIKGCHFVSYEGGHDDGIKKPELMQTHFSQLFEE